MEPYVYYIVYVENDGENDGYLSYCDISNEKVLSLTLNPYKRHATVFHQSSEAEECIGEFIRKNRERKNDIFYIYTVTETFEVYKLEGY